MNSTLAYRWRFGSGRVIRVRVRVRVTCRVRVELVLWSELERERALSKASTEERLSSMSTKIDPKRMSHRDMTMYSIVMERMTKRRIPSAGERVRVRVSYMRGEG